MTRRRVLLAALLVVVGCATAAVHWPVLSAQAACFDDQELFRDNHLVQNPSWDSVGRFFGEVSRPSTVGGYYFPLTMTSLMLDWLAGGRPDNLRQFHRTNLALHVASTLLVLVIVYALFGDPWVAAAVSLVFGLHPLTVSSIAWVTERRTLLAAFWGLLCLAFYIQYARRGWWMAFVAAWSAYVLALLSKPTSAPLCLVLILMDFWPLNRLRFRTVFEKWPFLVMAGVAAVVTWLAQSQTATATASASVLARGLVQGGYLIAFYAWKMLWPVNLSPVYSTPEPMSLSNPTVLVHAAVTLGLVVLLVVSLRWTRALLTGGLVFLVILLPTLGIVQYTWAVAAEKYVYLPAVGLLMAAASWLVRYRRGPEGRAPLAAVNGAMAIVFVLVVAAEAWGARGYLQAWQSSESLGRRMVRVMPRSAHAHSMLGQALADAGRQEEGIRRLQHAIELDPACADAHYNLGVVLGESNRIDEAIAQYRETVRLWPRRVSAHNNLANLLFRKGDLDGAAQEYDIVTKLRPESPEAWYNFANLIAEAGRPDVAIICYQKALEAGGQRAEIYDRLGTALARCGNREGAVGAHGRAVELDPQDATCRLHLANALAAMGNDQEAVTHFRRAIELRPDYAVAHNNLGNSLLKLGKRAEALVHYREALRLRPDYALGHMNLADALLEDGQTEPAMEHYREAARLEPQNVGAHLRLGRALERIGQGEAAVKEYQRVLEINPQHAEARRRLEALRK